MAGFTTSMPTSLKVELFSGVHCFNIALSSLVGAGVSGQFTITGLAATTGIVVGMLATGTNVAAGAIVASVDSGTQVTVSKAHTGTVTSGTIGFAGDVFKIALGKVTPTGTYGAATINYSDLTGNTDETTGTGYTAGGFAWTAAQNITPTSTGTTSFTQWSVNPSWTSSSFSTVGCIIYNSTGRTGTANRAVYVGSFGGTQTVTSGTLTLVLPTNDATNAILRLA